MSLEDITYILTLKDGRKVEVWKDQDNGLWYAVDGDGTGYKDLGKLLEECAELPEKEA